MRDATYFHDQVVKLANSQAQYLIHHALKMSPAIAIPLASTLIRDYILHFRQPAQAIQFALDFHPWVERWSLWETWAPTLDLVLTVYELINSVSDQVRLLLYRSQTAQGLDDTDVAMEFATQALHLAESQQDSALIALTLNRIGLIAFSYDDLAGAQEAWTRACTLGASSFSTRDSGHIKINLGLLAAKQGRFDDAKRYFTEALGHYRPKEDALYVAKVHCNLVDLAHRQGPVSIVPQQLLAARDTFQQLGAHYEYILVENDLGYIHLQLGDLTAAQASFEAALSMCDDIGAQALRGFILSNLGELYITGRDWEKAVSVLVEARELAVLFQKPLLVAAIDVDRGRLLAVQGNITEARNVWAMALSIQRTKEAYLAAQNTEHLLRALPDDAETTSYVSASSGFTAE